MRSPSTPSSRSKLIPIDLSASTMFGSGMRSPRGMKKIAPYAIERNLAACFVRSAFA